MVCGQRSAEHAVKLDKASIESPFVEVVEEQAAYAAGFVAVPEVKILVAPALVAFIYIVAKRCAQIAGGLMPEAAVFVKGVIRRQIKPAPKPPDGLRSEERRVGTE